MLIRSISLFLKNPSLPPQVLSNLVFDYYLLFLPVLLYGFFQDLYQIALAYALIYGFSALILQSKKATIYLPFYAAIILLSSLAALAFESLFGYILSISAFLGVTIRDAQQSVFHARLSDLSDSPRAFSIMTVLGVILIPVFTMGANIGFSFVTEGSATHALWIQVILSLILMILLTREPRVVRSPRSDDNVIPTSVRIMSWYSTFYNATSFPIRMIVSPLIIYAAVRGMGYDQEAISITGAIIGFVAILGILLRFLLPTKDIDNKTTMVNYHRAGILIMIAILLVSYGIQSSWWSPKAMPWVVSIVVLLQLGLEITGKFWSIGFIGVLRELTIGEGHIVGVYQAGYLHFMSMKNFGSFLGFLLAAGSYLAFSVPITVVVTGMAGILLVALTINSVFSDERLASTS